MIIIATASSKYYLPKELTNIFSSAINFNCYSRSDLDDIYNNLKDLYKVNINLCLKNIFSPYEIKQILKKNNANNKLD